MEGTGITNASSVRQKLHVELTGATGSRSITIAGLLAGRSCTLSLTGAGNNGTDVKFLETKTVPSGNTYVTFTPVGTTADISQFDLDIS